jgi:hypothetical protein
LLFSFSDISCLIFVFCLRFVAIFFLDIQWPVLRKFWVLNFRNICLFAVDLLNHMASIYGVITLHTYCHAYGVRVTYNNGPCIAWLNLLTPSFTITLKYRQYSAATGLLTSRITRTCHPFPGNGSITQKLYLSHCRCHCTTVHTLSLNWPTSNSSTTNFPWLTSTLQSNSLKCVAAPNFFKITPRHGPRTENICHMFALPPVH